MFRGGINAVPQLRQLVGIQQNTHSQHGLSPELELLVVEILQRCDRLLRVLFGQQQQAQKHLASSTLLVVHGPVVDFLTQLFDGQLDLLSPGTCGGVRR